ncbi:hypothetical protein [Hymenobacter armeniacus]|uniref:Outer membrane protein beta-barrel domain-containing protein n=1 Tax=Hymenobacter armeniacus TaxID=2771358 RepID=A0ABR8JSK1_9BACT|nr:hypothetical protein [Hymenobacter armeniacus]MBD2720654.1 hypothetical protein [Hymenobacter armeniacus]
MKFLPLLVCHLFPIVSIYARTSPLTEVADSSLYFGKKPLVKSVKLTSFERYQWDASVDASFILPSFYQVYATGYYGNTAYGYGNGLNAYGYGSVYNGVYTFANTRSTRLMFRKNESVMNATNIPVRKGAYRAQLYIGGGYSQTSKDSVQFSNNVGSVNYYFPKSNTSFSIGVGLGYEWQHQLGRFQLIYGYDVFARYNSASDTGTFRNGRTAPDATSTDNHSFSAGVAPLAGVKYFVSSQFSISFESTYSIGYYSSSSSFTGPIYGVFGRSYKEQGISYGLTPLSAINATFHFGQTNP